MPGLEDRWKALKTQLDRLESEGRKARGVARKRIRRLDRRTRVTIEKMLRRAEPRVRQAAQDAARLGRGLRAGVKAGAAAYRDAARTRK